MDADPAHRCRPPAARMPVSAPAEDRCEHARALKQVRAPVTPLVPLGALHGEMSPMSAFHCFHISAYAFPLTEEFPWETSPGPPSVVQGTADLNDWPA